MDYKYSRKPRIEQWMCLSEEMGQVFTSRQTVRSLILNRTLYCYRSLLAITRSFIRSAFTKRREDYYNQQIESNSCHWN